MLKRFLSFLLTLSILLSLLPMVQAQRSPSEIEVPMSEENGICSEEPITYTDMQLASTDDRPDEPADLHLSIPEERTCTPEGADKPLRGADDFVFSIDKTNGKAYLLYGSESLSGDVVIPDYYQDYPVCFIADNAFSYNDSITSVVLPSTLEEIWNRSFLSCENLSSVQFPPMLKSIGQKAFAECPKLTQINLPDSVTTISDNAFSGTGITTFYVPKLMRNMNANMFRNTKLQAFTTSDECLNYSAVDGILYSKDLSTLVCVPVGLEMTQFTVPNGVRCIAEYAFYGLTTLQSITLPEGLERIEYAAFALCENIASITLPSSLQFIGGHAFNSTAIVSITLPESLQEFSNMAFRECTQFCELSVAENNPYLCAVDNVLYTKDLSTLLYCPPLTNATQYTVPDGVKVIAESAFCDAVYLSTVNLPQGLERIGEAAFYKSSVSNIAIPDTVTFIGDFAFASSRITSLNIPDGVTFVSYFLCESCYYLEHLTIGKGARYIDMSAFAYCDSLTDVTIDPESQLQVLWNCVFRGCRSLPSIELPDNIRYLMDGVFSECYALKSVKMPKSLERIEYMVFDRCTSLERLTLHEGLLEIGRLAFVDCSKLMSINIPSSLTALQQDAFKGCDKLTLQIPDGLQKDIGGCYYRGQTLRYEGTREYDMANDVLRQVNQIRSAEGLQPLAYSQELTEQAMLRAAEIVFLFSHVRPNGILAPYNLSNVNGENIAAGYATSESVMGGWMDSPGHRDNILTSMYTDIGVGSFRYNGRMYWVQLFGCTEGDGQMRTGQQPVTEQVLVRTDAVATVSFIPSYLEEAILEGIGLYTSLYQFNLSPILQQIQKGSSASYSYNLTSVEDYGTYCDLPIEYIEWSSDAPEIASISGGTVIGQKKGSTYITAQFGLLNQRVKVEVLDPNDPTPSTDPKDHIIEGVCGPNAKWSLNSLTKTITISGSGIVSEAPWRSTSGAELIETVIVEDGILTLCDSAFYGCEKLSSVKLPDTLKQIGRYAFAYCPSLTSVTFPESLHALDAYCFGSTALERVFIPKNCVFFMETSFFDCEKLAFIEVDKENPSYENDVYGALYSKYGSLVFLPPLLAGSYSVKEGTHTIEDSAFYCSSVASITIPESVEAIDISNFYTCDALEKFIVSPENPFYASDDSGVLFNSEMTELILAPTKFIPTYCVPEGVEVIGDYAFLGIEGLSELTLPQSLQRIGNRAFYTDSIEVITIPQNVEFIGSMILSYLTKVIFIESRTCRISSLQDFPSALIVCYKGSTAEQYAIDNGHDYRYFGEPCTQHVFDSGVQESVSSCLTQGITLYTCLLCGAQERREEAYGYHIFDEGVVLKEPTCSVYGEMLYTCTYCGYSYTEYIDMTEHTFTQVIVPPTCTKQGYTSFVCQCGYAYSENYQPPIGHSFTDGICENCGEAENSEIPVFIDISENDWFFTAVQYAIRNGLMNGMGNQRFQPNTAMSRAMLVTVLWRFAGEANDGDAYFYDVKDGDWFAAAVRWASYHGIVNGVGYGRFDPNGNVTREQLAAILYRYCQSMGIATNARADLTAFPDGSKVSTWAQDAMSWAYAEGLITGSNENGIVYLAPQGNATRAQVATILMRFIENVVKAQ